MWTEFWTLLTPPPSLWTDKVFWPIILENHVKFWKKPSSDSICFDFLVNFLCNFMHMLLHILTKIHNVTVQMKTPNSCKFATVQHVLYLAKVLPHPLPPCGPTGFFQEHPSPFAVHMVYEWPLARLRIFGTRIAEARAMQSRTIASLFEFRCIPELK